MPLYQGAALQNLGLIQRLLPAFHKESTAEQNYY